MIRKDKAIKPRNRRDGVRAFFHGLLRSSRFWAIMLAYVLIALMVFIYLKREPVFASQMALVLPGTGFSTNFSLDEVGQASAQTKTPFAGGSFNPRVNYKEIIKSSEVIQQAAKQLNIEKTLFQRPKVKLTQQTSIIQVTVTGSTGLQAKEKNWALYHAFQTQLDALRADESLRQHESVDRVLAQYEQRLHETQEALIQFQQRALLVSEDQWDSLSKQHSTLKEKQMYLRAEYQNLENLVRQLGNDLGVSPELAGQAFTLQSDSEFQGYLQEFQESASRLSEYRSYWGERHPKVNSERNRFDTAKKALFKRTRDLVGITTADALHTMNLQVSPNRSKLFADLVEQYAVLAGKKSEMDQMEIAESKLSDQLKIYARELSQLKGLTREAKLAEAVYTSAAARLDASKSDVFASYPIIQMMTPPSEPIQQKSPNKKLAIAVGIMAYIIITLGFVAIWQRDYLIKRLLKKS